MRKQYAFYSILLLVILLLAGCKTKQIKTTTPDVVNETADIELLFKEVMAMQPSYQTLNISQMEAQLMLDNRDFSLRCTVKAKRGEFITISILPVLGIEIYRITFTPKSFIVLDRLNRQYCENDYSYLKKLTGFNINFDHVEALLSAQLFLLEGTTSVTSFKKNFNLQLSDTTYKLLANQKIGTLLHQFEVSPTYQIKSTALTENTLEVISFAYDNYQIQGDVTYPMNMSVRITNQDRAATVDLVIKKAVFNKEVEAVSADLTRYTKVSCSQALP